MRFVIPVGDETAITIGPFLERLALIYGVIFGTALVVLVVGILLIRYFTRPKSEPTNAPPQ